MSWDHEHPNATMATSPLTNMPSSRLTTPVTLRTRPQSISTVSSSPTPHGRFREHNWSTDSEDENEHTQDDDEDDMDGSEDENEQDAQQEQQRSKRTRSSTTVSQSKERKRQKRYGQGRCNSQDVSAILNMMHNRRITLRQFLDTIISDSAHHNCRKSLRKAFIQNHIPGSAKVKFVDSILVHTLQATGWRVVKKKLGKELRTFGKNVVQKRLRNETQQEQDVSQWFSQTFLQDMANVNKVKDYAPTWYSLLLSVTTKHGHNTDLHSGRDTRWVGPLLANLCAQLRPRTYNSFQCILGMYLWSQNLTKTGLDTLRAIGVASSYWLTNTNLKRVIIQHKEKVKEWGKHLNRIVVYDNFQLTDGVRDKRMGDENIFHSVTTGFVKLSESIPEHGILTTMYRPEYQLTDKDVLPLNRDFLRVESSMQKRLWWHYIYESMRTCLPQLESLAEGFHSTESNDFKVTLPLLGVPATHKRSQTMTLGPLLYDEATESGNAEISSDIHEMQFGLEKNDEQWSRNLFMHVGDALTTTRIHAMQANRAVCETAYNKCDWILPVFGLWHLCYNYVKLIIDQHLGGQSDDTSTLWYTWSSIYTSRSIDTKDYTQMHQLITHSFRSRIVALMIRYIRETQNGSQLSQSKHSTEDASTIHQQSTPVSSVFIEGTLKLEDVMEWWSIQQPDVLEHAIRWILQQISQPVQPDVLKDGYDEEYQNHIHFLRNVWPYMVLCDAIRFCDTQLLRFAIRRSLVIFSAHSQKWVYQRELCYYLWLTCTQATDTELQDIILKDSLVNRQGKPDSYYPMDKANELINLNLRLIKTGRRTSSLPMRVLLERYLRTADFRIILSQDMESTFGINRNNIQVKKTEQRHTWLIAVKLATDSMQLRSGLVHVPNRGSITEIKDLYMIGQAKVGFVIKKFNVWRKAIRQTGTKELNDAVSDQVLDNVLANISQLRFDDLDTENAENQFLTNSLYRLFPTHSSSATTQNTSTTQTLLNVDTTLSTQFDAANGELEDSGSDMDQENDVGDALYHSINDTSQDLDPLIPTFSFDDHQADNISESDQEQLRSMNGPDYQSSSTESSCSSSISASDFNDDDNTHVSSNDLTTDRHLS